MVKFIIIWLISFFLSVYLIQDSIYGVDAQIEAGIGYASVMSIFVTVVWELIIYYFRKRK